MPTTKDMLEFEYGRSALKNGLRLEAKLGTNPYKFGLVGSTDAHTGLAAAEEENFFGKVTASEPSPERLSGTFMNNPKIGVAIMDWEVSSSGYAAVWATDNTREAIWDAMQRRETYATTGPRILVRFFGGWEFTGRRREPEPWRDRLHEGRADGRRPHQTSGRQDPDVPRGGAEGPDRCEPRPHSDRKGLARREGGVAGEGVRRRLERRTQARHGRQAAARRQHCRRRERDVDEHHRSRRTDRGLDGPRFDAAERAFYYVRVIEIPTPRWTAFDAKRFGVKPPPGTRMTITERGYTSPIWYMP